MTLFLGRLNRNLHEILYAVRQEPGKLKLNLVANYWGTAIYFSQDGWGRVWTWVYSFLDYLGLKDVKNSAFKQALVKTHQAFLEYSSIASDYHKLYQTYFHYLLTNKPFDKTNVALVRSGLIEWMDASQAMIKQMNKANGIACEIGLLFKEANLGISIQAENLKHCSSLIALEALFDGNIPVQALVALGKEYDLNANIDEEKEKQIAAWINALQGSTLSVKVLHQALVELVDSVNSQPSHDKIVKVDILEAALTLRGCNIFHINDTNYIKRRNALKFGDAIICNGKNWTLGNKIACDKYVVFELKEDSSKFVMFANNPVSLKIEYVIGTTIQWGFTYVLVHEVDEKGACVIIERLDQFLDQYTWTSNQIQLSEKDQLVALTVSLHIDYCREQRLFPQDVSSKDLIVSKNGELKTIKPYFKCAMNEKLFEVLERLCFEISKKNEWVSLYLMEVSHLSLHPLTKYFQAVFEESITKGQVSIISIRIPEGFDQAEVDKLAKDLCEKGLALIKMAFGIDKKTATFRMLYYYKKYGVALGCNAFWEMMTEKIKEQPRSDEIILDRKYYEGQRKMMFEKEKKALQFESITHLAATRHLV